ncbi:ribosomal RNA-processing 7 protein [Perilla frutescens var. hirtella]|nr:ribosomal RNA-processing 7 protein [Perilla frutescens var. hirtella]KAH6806462.1 ribosomal RNA-processing 7 protein [Perilla frutescens var. frutescens]
MGAEDSIKKLKRKKNAMKGISQTAQIGDIRVDAGMVETHHVKGDIKVDVGMLEIQHVKDVILETSGGKKKSQKLRDKKRKQSEIVRRDPEDFDASHINEAEDIPNSVCAVGEPSKDKLLKSRKKKRKNVESINRFDESNKKNDASEQCEDSKPEEQFRNSGGIIKRDTPKNSKRGKSKGPEKMKEKTQLVANHISSITLLEKRAENAEDEVYQMSSGDEDYSKGMKKWITQYHQSRPGVKVLQERIDDFIMAHEAREEQARAEKLAQAAEGGWTVVVHQKGRKKTTEAESGIAVGSVAQAAVLDKMGKKKKKDVGLDFYQFNRREAHRNEIMMLQSKFEQDKQRIQQMRAARKFRPY